MSKYPDSDLPPELRGAVDQYDRHHNAEVLEDYEELFHVLREMHKRHPNWRFGQMITNLAAWSGKSEIGDAYCVPDERLLEIAREYLAKGRDADSVKHHGASRV